MRTILSEQGFAIGTTVAAACLLFVAGIVALLQGIAALADNDLLIVGVNYTFEFDVTTWGWIHIVLGIIGIAVSLGLFVGMTWARGMAFVIAALSIVANFLWMPYYPAVVDRDHRPRRRCDLGRRDLAT